MTFGTNLASRHRTDYLVVHTAETYHDQDVSAADINRWHINQGWACIGYHRVIRRDGTIEQGRPDDAIGAHVKAHNFNTWGVCLAGGLMLVRREATEFPDVQLMSKPAFLGKHLNPKYVAHTDKRGVTIYDANYTPAQLEALRGLLDEMLHKYPGAHILGHRDIARDGRVCPLFNVNAWWSMCHDGMPTPTTVRTSLTTEE